MNIPPITFFKQTLEQRSQNENFQATALWVISAILLILIVSIFLLYSKYDSHNEPKKIVVETTK